MTTTAENHTEVIVDSPKPLGKISLLECSMDFHDAESIKFFFVVREILEVHYFPSEISFNNDPGVYFEAGGIHCHDEANPFVRQFYDEGGLVSDLYNMWELSTNLDLGLMEDEDLQARYNWIDNEVAAIIQKYKIEMPSD